MREYAEPGRPVILQGAADGWNAERTGSVDFLRERFGSHTVEVTRSDGPGAQGTAMRVDEYVDSMRGQRDERPLYLTSGDIRDGLEDLQADFATPACFADDWFARMPDEVRPHLTWLFVGPAPGCTSTSGSPRRGMRRSWGASAGSCFRRIRSPSCTAARWTASIPTGSGIRCSAWRARWSARWSQERSSSRPAAGGTRRWRSTRALRLPPTTSEKWGQMTLFSFTK